MLPPIDQAVSGGGSARTATRKTVLSTNWLRVGFIVAVFLLYSGVPTLLAGFTSSLGRMVAAGIALFAPLFAVLIRPQTFRLSRPADFFPFLMFVWFFFVSFISNTLVFRYGLNNWLLPMYLVVPILFYYLWWGVGASSAEMTRAIMAVGIISAIITVSDQILQFPALDEMKRLSAFTERSEARRIVFLRNECTLALLLILASLLKFRGVRDAKRAVMQLAALVLMSFMIFRVFESRIAMAAIVVAIVTYLIFARATVTRRTLMIGGMAVVAIPVIFYAVERYLAPLINLGVSGYVEEFNVDIRFDSFAYWLAQFENTLGLGIGVMTVNPDTPNIQSSVIDQSFILNDMGIAAALFQFGVPGLIAAVAGTIYLIRRLLKLGRSRHPRAAELFMMGCFVLAFELQPIPVSFLTVVTALPLGATLWYAARRAAWEATQLPAAVRRDASEPLEAVRLRSHSAAA